MVSFYWFDYETFGTHPAWDRPCQFAGVRTDEQLNVIGESMTLYCRQAPDYLPQPGACRVTGITPQLANEKGLPEAQFIQRVVEQIGQRDTCSVGYNSIRFDDEFTRHTLFRNLHDPYEQEWKDGNSRWDLIDVVRLTRALRPDGIQWPFNDDGTASNRLEHLSILNGIEHGQAHDAMSDVWATIGMARLIRDAQPRLFNYVFSHRSKASVSQILNTQERTASLQVSGMIPGTRHNVAAILPLTRHPKKANGIIVLDLQHDPRYLLELDADEIALRLFQTAGEHPDSGHARPGLRTIYINKCPVIVPLSTLRPVDAERLHMDRAQIEQHAQWAREICTEQMLEQIRGALSREWQEDSMADVDGSLYGGPFLTQADKKSLHSIREMPAKELAVKLDQLTGHFDDGRLDEMVWRYLARNYPDALSSGQRLRWEEQCSARLADSTSRWLGADGYQQALDEIDWSPEETALEMALRDYALQLAPARLTPSCRP